MRIVEHHIFTYDQFRQIKVLTLMLQGLKMDGKTLMKEQGWWERNWLLLNGYPLWGHCEVLVVDERNDGQFEIYVKRPFTNGWKDRMYREKLIRADQEQKEALLELLLRSEPYDFLDEEELDLLDRLKEVEDLQWTRTEDLKTDHLTVLGLSKELNVQAVTLGKVYRHYVNQRKWYNYEEI